LLTTQDRIDELTTRIEKAYRLRCPQWHGGCSSSRVWAVAVARLLEANHDDPALPVDPELYVASQVLSFPIADPWTELTGTESVRRYRDRINTIVRGLHAELSGEVRIAERRITAGQTVAQVLGAKTGRISPLGRYVVAIRASRERLAKKFLEAARKQIEACPLYREAFLGLISAADFPVPEEPAGSTSDVSGINSILSRATVYRN